MLRSQGGNPGMDGEGLSGRLLEILPEAEVPPFSLDERFGLGGLPRDVDGPTFAVEVGPRRHLSRKSFAFLTQTGGPSCLEALGRDATSSSKRNKASLPTRSNRESNTWKADRWSRSANDRWAFRNCG